MSSEEAQKPQVIKKIPKVPMPPPTSSPPPAKPTLSKKTAPLNNPTAKPAPTGLVGGRESDTGVQPRRKDDNNSKDESESRGVKKESDAGEAVPEKEQGGRGSGLSVDDITPPLTTLKFSAATEVLGHVVQMNPEDVHQALQMGESTEMTDAMKALLLRGNACGSSVRFITEDELKQLEQANLSLPEDAVLLVNYRRKSAPLPTQSTDEAKLSMVYRNLLVVAVAQNLDLIKEYFGDRLVVVLPILLIGPHHEDMTKLTSASDMIPYWFSTFFAKISSMVPYILFTGASASPKLSVLAHAIEIGQINTAATVIVSQIPMAGKQPEYFASPAANLVTLSHQTSLSLEISRCAALWTSICLLKGCHLPVSDFEDLIRKLDFEGAVAVDEIPDDIDVCRAIRDTMIHLSDGSLDTMGATMDGFGKVGWGEEMWGGKLVVEGVAREWKSLASHMQAGGMKLQRAEQIPKDTPDEIDGGLEGLLGFLYLRLGSARIAREQGEELRVEFDEQKATLAGRDKQKEGEMLERAIPALRRVRGRDAALEAELGLGEGKGGEE